MRDSALESSYVYKVSKYERFKSVFNHIIKFISNFLFMLFVVIILVVLVYGLYTKKNGNNGYVPIVSAYVIVSPSMVPTINVYDAVVSYRPNISTLKKGDIITFNSTDARYVGRTVTHRILGITDIDGQVAFRTKGDNNTTPDDAHVLGSNIYGKVFFVIPWLGYLQILLTHTYGWLLLVVCPCVGIIIYDIIKLAKTIKKNRVVSNRNFKNVEIDDDATLNENTDSSTVLSDEKILEKNFSKEENVTKETSNIVVEAEEKFIANTVTEDIVVPSTATDSFRHTIVIASQFERRFVLPQFTISKDKTQYSREVFEVIVASHFSRENYLDIQKNEHSEEVINKEKEEKEIDSYIEIL